MTELERIVKYSRPTKYDHGEYGQVWDAELEEDVEHYIQVSRDVDNPEWCELGSFFITALMPYARHNDMKRYLEMYENTMKALEVAEGSDSTMRPWEK